MGQNLHAWLNARNYEGNGRGVT